jgi:hypothetical protein
MRHHLNRLTGMSPGGPPRPEGPPGQGGSPGAGRSPRRVRTAVTAGAAAITLAVGMVMAVGFAPRASAATVPAPPSGWSTVFSDDFSGAAGSGVDSQWTDDIGNSYSGTGCSSDWGTGEVETATDSTANVSENGSGDLDITPVDSGGSWTSGRIETVQDGFDAPAGGEMEVSASIEQPNPSDGTGYWPAFWMLGDAYRDSGAGTSGTMDCSAWPGSGEVDIMEDVNALSEVSGTLHCGVDPGGPCNETDGLGSGLVSCSGCQTGYNTYSVIVNRTDTSDESITYYLNGNAYYTVDESQVGTSTWEAAVDNGFFLILDVAMGGAYPNAICGCSSPTASTSSGAAMSVGYVAVYETSGGSSTGGGGGSGSGTSCSTTATSYISADCYSSSQGSPDVTSATGDTNPSGVDGNQVADLQNGDYLEYDNINFGSSGSTQFDAQVASGAADGVSGLIEVVLDNPDNTPVGSFSVGNTGGWTSWETVPANISTVTGTHNVYLEFVSGASGDPPFVSLHYFDFPAT